MKCVALALALAGPALAAPAADSVPTLPQYGTPPTAMYSGYLDAKGTSAHPGCAATEAECKLHYWFAAAKNNPETAPVVLWLNGGPGSSSILGMLQEQGPLIINATGGLMVNPYSRINMANLVVLESPTGVGYSYCSTQIAGGVCKNTDKLTAASARAAMVDFFGAKFPELAKNEFFISGESYGGVYVPTLSKEILDNAPPGAINFKGVSVGDPCTDNTAQKDSMDMLWYGHKNGFVPEQEYDLLWNQCSMRSPAVLSKGRWAWGQNQPAANKAELVEQFRAAHSLDAQRARHHKLHGVEMSPACTLAYRKFLASSSKGFSQGWINAYINNLSLYGASALVSFDLPGSMNYATKTYMQRPDVQAALHVDSGPSRSWPDVKQGFDYTSDYDACNGDVAPGAWSMIDFYRDIAPRLDTTLVMNGDTDPCVSYEGTRVAMTRVGFAEVDGGSYRPWFYNHTAASYVELHSKTGVWGPDLSLSATGIQMGGSIVNYEHGLAFQTVHGAGHMVPQFRPQASLHQIAKVLLKQDFAPLLPTNATLANMTDAEYDTALDKWTLAAKAAPYTDPFLI